jgi:hypothetical protein
MDTEQLDAMATTLSTLPPSLEAFERNASLMRQVSFAPEVEKLIRFHFKDQYVFETAWRPQL